MTRVLFLFVAALGIVALIARTPSARRLLYVILALMVLYTILKLTGVIDAAAPVRNGVS